ncbi:peptidoglycan DD-metalloendopeptidase family protein [Candidatus Gracilibacteria bacterium]|nr:peptidoglycan DD-metalloendopeptidase family protein [Candidatus Gracilibacteria bacterium]MCF7898645.1 peptidoglycan DD-metalloendopeptidase family protein [Candidatus Paceibacterota bacterium]
MFFIITAILVLLPNVTHASVFSNFKDKLKSIFIKEEEIFIEDVGTSQTMALFRPTVIDTASASGVADENQNLEVMQATAGPLRISTEDVVFPSSDKISVYEVKKGDTLGEVAELFNVSVNTIMWANDLKSQTLKLGDTLVILPITGIKHSIKKGETINSIAKKYKADKGDIAKFNGISEDAELVVGDTVLVPDGEILVAQAPKPKSSSGKSLNSYSSTVDKGFLVRPVTGGRRSQGIHGHNGVDIAASPGTSIVASASGRVIVARSSGYNGGYGSMVIISHSNGVQTVYAHMREVNVVSGQTVSQGEVIGGIGNTGKSTGPHLHFEVRGAKNPF